MDLSGHNIQAFPLQLPGHLFQLDPSVQAACTRTTLASVLALVMIAFLSYLPCVCLRDFPGGTGRERLRAYEEPPLRSINLCVVALEATWRPRKSRMAPAISRDESLTRSGPCRRNALPRYGCRVECVCAWRRKKGSFLPTRLTEESASTEILLNFG